MTRVAGVIVVQRLAGNRIDSHRARQRRYWLPCLSGRRSVCTDRHRIRKDGIALMAYLGWVITSIMYGKPFFTEATPRFSAGPSLSGSVIGPSPAMPYDAAIIR